MGTYSVRITFSVDELWMLWMSRQPVNWMVAAQFCDVFVFVNELNKSFLACIVRSVCVCACVWPFIAYGCKISISKKLLHSKLCVRNTLHTHTHTDSSIHIPNCVNSAVQWFLILDFLLFWQRKSSSSLTFLFLVCVEKLIFGLPIPTSHPILRRQ